MTVQNEIRVQGVTKQFQKVKALDNVSVTFGGNRIYGLLGRNGAGKSTLLNLISNRLFPTEGSITINGMPAAENDAAQGLIYCMSEKNLYVDVKISEIFKTAPLLYPGFDLEYALQLCKEFALSPQKRLKQLSTGYTSIFKLIMALSSGAEYLLLDEPVLGLDANHRDLFYRLLLKLYSETPKTIVISTHLIEEVATLIEQVIIIKEGKILLDAPTEEVLKMGYCVSGKASLIDSYLVGKQPLSVEQLGGLKTACFLGSAQNLPAELECSPLDLQKLFIQLTNS